jgi:lipopolysaccharide assembly outer membrane protein LptD (OstA)
MKKMSFLVICIIGSAVLSSGQTNTGQGQFYRITAPGQQITADSIVRTGATTWHFRGAVRIVQDATIIGADEVDAQTTNGAIEYDLRGNVHLTINTRK